MHMLSNQSTHLNGHGFLCSKGNKILKTVMFAFQEKNHLNLDSSRPRELAT